MLLKPSDLLLKPPNLFPKSKKIYIEENTASSTNVAGHTAYLHVEE